MRHAIFRRFIKHLKEDNEMIKLINSGQKELMENLESAKTTNAPPKEQEAVRETRK
jgi:hypothetical protein